MSPGPLHLRSEGVSVLLAPSLSGEPVVLHWGADLGELAPELLESSVGLRSPGVPHSALDEPRWTGLVPSGVDGFTGTPAVEVWRPASSATWAPALVGGTWEHQDDAVCWTCRDDEAEVGLETRLELTPEGLVRQRHTLTNTGSTELVVSALRMSLPIPSRAEEILDLTGRWCRERSPQRHRMTQGTYLRQGRHGRTGHDATLLLMAGTPGFDFRTGEVFGVHVAWSGDQATYAERTAEGECLLGGHELLGPGEVRLAAGESYAAPWLVAAWSGHGVDGLSDRLHPYVRKTNPRPAGVRPVVVNTWEATYFDHDLSRLTTLADRAAEVGAERYVLDDGWFRGRRDDRRGLGDWTVDRDVWPQGLHPLVDHVRGLGLEFGLWVEPEMVNEDSDLVRAHPDWVLRGRAATPQGWRHQQVLDLQNDQAYAHVRDALMALLAEYPIDFVKWDHNRDLVDVAHGGRPAVHGQTEAFYRLLDELRAAHPGLEIESCASGGGRIDLGVLERTDRVWPSDTLDPVERQTIQQWTSLLVPAELIGSHVGAGTAHTTGRRTSLDFRAATSLLWHFGLEQDLTGLAPQERDRLAFWVDLHKRVRSVVHRGRLVRGDDPDPSLVVCGGVDPEQDEAVYVIATVASLRTQSPPLIRLPGLRPDRSYHVEVLATAGPDHPTDLGSGWWAGIGLTAAGSVLGAVGVRLPVLVPESAVVIAVRAVDR